LVFWQKQKEKNIKLLNALITGEEDPSVAKIDEYFALYVKPKNFYGSGSEELKYDKSFEQNCIVLSQYSNKSVKDCTVREYFTLIDHFNKILKEQRRNQKK